MTAPITIHCTTEDLAFDHSIETLIPQLNTQKGVLLTSNFEYPGRYSRWDLGFINPPIQIQSRHNTFIISALNDRGKILLQAIAKHLESVTFGSIDSVSETQLEGTIHSGTGTFSEEDRSKQPSIFSLIRSLIALFKIDNDAYLGLYGALGYDLVFQFETIPMKIERPADQRDLVLYIPDELIVVDHNSKSAQRRRYDFETAVGTTVDIPRTGASTLSASRQSNTISTSTQELKPGEYAKLTEAAKAWFRRGDLFEVVPGQTFYEPCKHEPSVIFSHLRQVNPAPYSCFMNLGDDEYLVGVSPEMFVRVQGKRVETCPISGTIERGLDPIADADNILKLLSSEKEKSELTMCTDVDRNDKSRVCEPGSVKVIGRRQIEMYSKVIHTVDHVEGTLRDGYDAIDAFLTHMWAVTVTGAPKLWAMRFIEQHETTCRHWYGGAIGLIGFNGDMNTGLTLRTMRIKNKVAHIRVGATLLIDSDPEAEEKETEIKAAALIAAARNPILTATAESSLQWTSGRGKHVLILDHEDSFVHTLANYLRQTGATVTTLRVGMAASKLADYLNSHKTDLVVLSPGPGCPSDFNAVEIIKTIRDANCPIFGICLGLQSIVEYFGGTLKTLGYPMHGKESIIHTTHSPLFKGLPETLSVGRYHSLYADKDSFPYDKLKVTAETEDGIIMGIEHKTLPIAAVQFHPESIMTLKENAGLQIIDNAMKSLCGVSPHTP